MNPKQVLEILQELRALPYFPNDEYVMNALVKLCGSMCNSLEQVKWLVDRMTSGIYAQWPGPAEMRACLCCRYKPKDGVTAHSSVYPEGLPPDPTAPPRAGIAGPSLKALPPGAVTEDSQPDRQIQRLARLKDMDRHAKPEHKPMTEARRAEIQREIDQAVEKLREQRAKQEAEG